MFKNKNRLAGGRVLRSRLFHFIFTLCLSSWASTALAYPPKSPPSVPKGHVFYGTNYSMASGTDLCPAPDFIKPAYCPPRELFMLPVDSAKPSDRSHVDLDKKMDFKYSDRKDLARVFVWSFDHKSKSKQKKGTFGTNISRRGISAFKNKEQVWLVPPDYQDAYMWRPDTALVRDVKTGEWMKFDVNTQQATPIGAAGEVKVAPYIYDSRSEYKNLNGVYYLSGPSQGETHTITLLTEDNRAPRTIDGVASAEKMPLGRFPVEAFNDGSLLVHRIDSAGGVYDQIFSRENGEALTPAIPPLLIVKLSSQGNNQAVVEIDRKRRLFWPVSRGMDVAAKPTNLLGLHSPLGSYDTTMPAKPDDYFRFMYKTAEEWADSLSKYPRAVPLRETYKLKECSAALEYSMTSDATGVFCDVDLNWVAVWDTPRGIRLALIQEPSPSYDQILASYDEANYVAFKSTHNNGLKTAMQHEDGYVEVFDVNRHRAPQRTGLFSDLRQLKPLKMDIGPFDSLQQAASFIIKSRKDREGKERAEAIAKRKAWEDRQKAIAEEKVRAREERIWRRETLLEEYQVAVNAGDIDQVFNIGWQIGGATLSDAVIKTIRAGRDDLINQHVLVIARHSANPSQRTFLSEYLAAWERKPTYSNTRWAGFNTYTPSSSSSIINQSYQTYPNYVQQMKDSSRDSYNSGTSSFYFCGSTSTCR